ncbi:MAG: caspase family protein [bacterium]
MSKRTLPIFLLCMGLTLCFDSLTSQSYAQWFNAYKSGLKAMKKKEWHRAIEHFQDALNVKSKDTKKIRARGVMFIEYYPNRELGVCYFNLGEIDQAKFYLATSISHIVTRRAKRFLTRINRGETPPRRDRLRRRDVPEWRPRKKMRPRRPSVPAQLAVDLYFVEPSNNGFLDAEESGKIIVDITNDGRGDAYELRIKTTPESDISGIRVGHARPIDHLAPGTQQSVVIPVSCDQHVASRDVRLRIDVAEANGFDLDPPSHLTFSTKALEPPDLVIADIGIDDNSKNRRIEPREMVDITARIKNVGQGQARVVRAAIQTGENVFLTPDSQTEFMLGDLRQGEFKDVKFTVFTNSKATSVPINILLREERGRYDKTLPLDLPFNKPQLASKDLIVTGRQGPDDIESAPLTIDVDTHIPKSKNYNQDAIAIILGVEQYAGIPNVTFAKRDAAIFKEYAIKVLGVPDSKNNIYYKTDQDVTKGEFLKLFTGKGWLKKRAQPTSDVYIYFAGHGAPDIKEKMAYLIPFDGDANYPSQTGFSLNQFYDELSTLNAKSITVFIDACFSGGTRENTMLLADARPVLIKVENPVLRSDNLVVFSAASGHEISSAYPDKEHGLFTYFLLKGLRGEADKNYDAAISIAELEAYLIANVKRTAGTLDREQTPQVLGRNKEAALVRF